LQGDRDGVLGMPGPPWLRPQGGELAQPAAIEDLVGLADAQHRPSRPGRRVIVIDLEPDYGVAGGGGEFAAVAGAEDDVFVVEHVVDLMHVGQRGLGDHDPPASSAISRTHSPRLSSAARAPEVAPRWADAAAIRTTLLAL